jgi:CRISPR-associated protein Csx10
MTETAKLTVTLAEPVAAVRHLRNDFRQESYDHIPGTVVRGALAAEWIRRRGEPDQEFLDVFEGAGVFGPLHSQSSLPVPLGVKVHKYLPGDECQQLWWDVVKGEKATHCAKCKQRLEDSKGGPTGRVRRTLRTRVALTAEGVAIDQNLFSQNSIAKGNVFTGWLSGPALRAVTIAGTPVDTLILGGKRSVQGRAEVAVDFDAVPEPVDLVGGDVILHLAAPGIFVDALGFPSDEPDRDELSEILGVEAFAVQRWTRWTEVGGWHEASGLPKPTERAVQTGSTYRVRCAEEPSEAARRALMARGVGLRRREGFGALYRPAEPVTFAGWRSILAQLRRDWDTAVAQLPRLRQRTEGLYDGIRDVTPFEDRLAVGDDYSVALRKLLDVSDPELYVRLLDHLEAGK